MNATVIHLGVQVSNLEKSIDFYKKLCSLDKVPVLKGQLGPMAFLKLGKFEFVLHNIHDEVVHKRNKLDHFGIQVENLNHTYQVALELKASTSKIHKSFGWWQFNVVDPDGYKFHVMSRRK